MGRWKQIQRTITHQSGNNYAKKIPTFPRYLFLVVIVARRNMHRRIVPTIYAIIVEKADTTATLVQRMFVIIVVRLHEKSPKCCMTKQKVFDFYDNVLYFLSFFVYPNNVQAKAGIILVIVQMAITEGKATIIAIMIGTTTEIIEVIFRQVGKQRRYFSNTSYFYFF